MKEAELMRELLRKKLEHGDTNKDMLRTLFIRDRTL
jgi:hypothetical protein